MPFASASPPTSSSPIAPHSRRCRGATMRQGRFNGIRRIIGAMEMSGSCFKRMARRRAFRTKGGVHRIARLSHSSHDKGPPCQTVTFQYRTVDHLMRERYTIAPSEEANRFHYELERRLSDQLRNSNKAERQRLFPVVYDELHEKVPYLLYIQDDASTEEISSVITARAEKALERFLRSQSTYLEIGPGGCKLVRRIARRVKHVYAVDVSMSAMLSGGPLPANVDAIVSDGTSVPVPAQSIDLAWSDNLIEHLHPEDAKEQLENIFAALRPGGRYMCCTPNRINGPHDISSNYGHTVAAGFHLKEYAYKDIIPLFKSVGFGNMTGYVDIKGKVVIGVPGQLLVLFETVLLTLPPRIRAFALRQLLVKAIIKVRICGQKPAIG